MRVSTTADPNTSRPSAGGCGGVAVGVGDGGRDQERVVLER